MKKMMLFLIMISMCFSSFAVEPYVDSEDPDEIFMEYCECEEASIQNTVSTILAYAGVDNCSDALNKLKTIKHIALYRDFINPNKKFHLGPLSSLVNLSSLTLKLHRTIVDSLETISELLSLEYLQVNTYADFDIRLLYPLKNLRTLNLENNAIQDITYISELKTIVTLKLRDNLITDFSPLIGLKDNLKFLYLTNSTPKGIKFDVSIFNGFTRLETLFLDWLTLKGFEGFANMPNLKELDVAYSKGVELWMLRETLPIIETLWMEDIGAKNIDILAIGKNLSTIGMEKNNIQSLRPLSYLKNLKNIYIAGNPIDPEKCPVDSPSDALNKVCLNLNQ